MSMSLLPGMWERATKSMGLLLLSSSRHLVVPSHRYTRGAVNHKFQHVALIHHHHHHRQPAPFKVSDPLHVLFCGSDEFSCAALEALHHEHVYNPALVRSISVVVRPGKRTGRGYKVVRDPPIRSLAHRLGLMIHERDTFTGWNMPSEVNLIIAVSFGLFVPPRLLRGAKYGGLNLHPSLLPDLRGPAPLQHTLLSGRTLTGVSLQTLDPKTFDHGLVLAQTPTDPSDPNTLHIPPNCKTVPQLQALVTPTAAKMLIQGLRDNLHVPPLEDKGWKPTADQRLTLQHAPKITTKDKQLTLAILRACDQESSPSPPGAHEYADAHTGTLSRRQAAIGPLWFWSRDMHGKKKRIIIEDLEDNNMPGFSPATRPSILGGPDAPNHDASYRRYVVPFEQEQNQEHDTKPEGRKPHAAANLVFFAPTDPSTFSVNDALEEPIAKEEREFLYLGNYRVRRLKVEGEKAKPARLALHNFIDREASD